VGSKSFTVTASDVAGNVASVTNAYKVQYAAQGTICMGAPSHQILPPVNADGSSVFKAGSTVPAKFRVCDASGVSIGPPGVVASFSLVDVINGTVTTPVADGVSSTNDLGFRWDPTS